MIRKLLLILSGFSIVFIISSIKKTNANGYFEGKIEYKNEFVIKSNKVDSAFLSRIFGKTATLFFKEGNYLEIYDNGFMIEQMYNRENNKVYIKKTQSDTLYWFNCGAPEKKMLKFEINRKKENILGIECDELVTYYENKIVSFYYNSDTLKINPEWYKNFILSNKNLNTKKMKAIYLKYKIEYPDFIATVTAVSVNWQKIEDRMFAVPNNKVLIEDN